VFRGSGLNITTRVSTNVTDLKISIGTKLAVFLSDSDFQAFFSF
jgi:hypothetical protein